jgi:hypothetical protein
MKAVRLPWCAGHAHDDPATGELPAWCTSSNGLEVVDRALHVVGTFAGASATAGLREPAAMTGHGDLVALQVLHAAGSAGQHEDVRTRTGDADTQRDTVHVHPPRLHAATQDHKLEVRSHRVRADFELG